MKSCRRRWSCGLLAALAVATAAQAQTAWLFGEQHDQPDHQRQTAAAVHDLAAAGRLQAVVLEMAARGRDTRGLSPDASETQVREALQWSESWPWARYREVVMNAVRAGVPVLGGNLPRERVRQVMAEPEWDRQVPEAARQRLLEAVREGHCGLLPASQLAPMVRVQIARDRALADTLGEATLGAAPTSVLVMLSGAVHASRQTGVPLHLSAAAPTLAVRSIRLGAAVPVDGFDEWRAARAEPESDHCAELERRGMPARGVPPTSASRPSQP